MREEHVSQVEKGREAGKAEQEDDAEICDSGTCGQSIMERDAAWLTRTAIEGERDARLACAG